MSAPLRVACIGEAMIELSGWQPGAVTATIGCAGDVLNTAVYLARLTQDVNIEVSFVTALGDDSFSNHMLCQWQSEGLNCAHVPRISGTLPGLYAIETDASGERNFHYWRQASAARQMFSPDGIDLAVLMDFDVIYLSGISLAILDTGARTKLLQLLQAFGDQGGMIAFDSNYRPSLWQTPAIARQWIQDLWQITHIALPTLSDEVALFGQADPAGRLLQYGPEQLLIKCGAKGVQAFNQGQPVATGKLPPADCILDTSGAGDSFNAAYLSARLHGQDMVSSIHAAHDMALKVIAAPGAILCR